MATKDHTTSKQKCAPKIIVSGDGKYWLQYIGFKEDLIAAGCCGEEMFAKKDKKCARRFDQYGDRYTINRWFVSREGRPIHRYKVLFKKPRDRAVTMPYGAEAVSAYEEYLRRREEHNKHIEEAQQQEKQHAAEEQKGPTNIAQWKESQLDGMRRFLNAIYDESLREELADRYPHDSYYQFRLSLEDDARLSEIKREFEKNYIALIRGARVIDRRPEAVISSRKIRLIINNR